MDQTIKRKKKQNENQIVNYFKLIITATGICAAAFGFILKQFIDLKNSEISVLERKNDLLETQVRIFEQQVLFLKDKNNLELNAIRDSVYKKKDLEK